MGSAMNCLALSAYSALLRNVMLALAYRTMRHMYWTKQINH